MAEQSTSFSDNIIQQCICSCSHLPQNDDTESKNWLILRHIFRLLQWATYFLPLKAACCQNWRYLQLSYYYRLNGIPKPKLLHSKTCIHYLEQHHHLSKIQDSGGGEELAICPNIAVLPNPKQAYA